MMFFFFFFQAEDGIRDGHVTGVQTCALPIFDCAIGRPAAYRAARVHEREQRDKQQADQLRSRERERVAAETNRLYEVIRFQIGRASCRERVEIAVVRVSVKRNIKEWWSCDNV